MASITPTILKDNKRKDDSYSVVFRLTHNRKSRYIKTQHYIDQMDLVDGKDMPMDYIIDYLSDDLRSYRKTLSSVQNIEQYDVDDLKTLLTGGDTEIELMSFFVYHIDKLNKQGRGRTARPFQTVYNSLVDFNGNKLFVSSLTSKFLERFEHFLRTPHTIQRIQGKVSITKENTFLTDKGLHNYMAALRTLFNEARKHYNDEEIGKIVIKNNPFVKYKIQPKKNKKHKNLSLDQIRTIRDYQSSSTREMMAVNMFIISFYLCGMNAVDLFQNWDKLKTLPERLGYNRSKTKGKREDDAYINMRVPDEAKRLIAVTQMKYTSSPLLNNSISKGLLRVSTNLNIPDITMLAARHSFATIARNDLNISRDDVSLALNHVSHESRITDTYLAPDWSKIDKVQKEVIKALLKEQ